MFLGTPEPQYQNDPVIKPDVDKAQPLATESTLKGISSGTSIMQSDLLSLNHKLSEKGVLYEALQDISDVLENSAIASHSKSPLEESIDDFKNSSVTFNEKTMRWHDSQTKLMVKGSDPRVAEALKPQPSMLEKAGAAVSGGAKSAWGGIKGLFSKKEDPDKAKAAANFMSLKDYKAKQAKNKTEAYGGKGLTPEEKKEAAVEDAEDDKVQKTQDTSLKGIWASMKERAKKSWFAENWKMLLAGLLFLFAPLKWIKKLWEWAKVAWTFTKNHPIIAGLLALGIYLAGPLNIIKFAIKGLSKLFGIFFKSKLWGSIASKVGGVASKAAGFVGKHAAKIGGGAALLAGVALAIKDGIAGARLSKEWGTSKAGGVAGAVLGGTDKGISGAFKNAGKWALIGAGIGSFVPVIGTLIGGLVGAGVGAIAGFFGGEAIAGWIDSIASTIKEWWFSIISFFKEGMMETWEALKEIWYEGLSWERIWKLLKTNPLFRLGEIIAEGIAGLWTKFKDKFSWIPGLGPDEEEEDGAKPVKKESGLVTQAKDVGSKIGDAAYGVAKATIGTPLGMAAKGIKAGIGGIKSFFSKPDPNAPTEQDWKDYDEALLDMEGQPLMQTREGADLSALLGDTKGAKLLGYDKSEAGTGFAEWSGGSSRYTPEQQKILYDAHLVRTTSGGDTSQMSAGYNEDAGIMWKTESVTGDRVNQFNEGAITTAQQTAQPGEEGYEGPLEIVPGSHRGYAERIDPFTGEAIPVALNERRLKQPAAPIEKEETPWWKKVSSVFSPDDKMDTMNALNAKNQTLQQGQSGSPTVISTTNAQATTNNSTGGVFTLNNPVSAPRLTTALADD